METKHTADRQEAYRVYTISLEGLSFSAFHGCLEQERRNGNHFRVDFEGEYCAAAGKSDSLDDALDYGEVYDVIATQMQKGPFNLLETLCDNIMNALIGQFPALRSIRIKVAKQNPPVNGPCEWSAVQCKWKKDE